MRVATGTIDMATLLQMIICESALGGATQKIAIGGRVKINSAAAISDGARNKWYARGPRKDGDNTKKWGFYHLLPDKVMAIRYN